MEEKIACNNIDALKIELRRSEGMVVITLETSTSSSRRGAVAEDKGNGYYCGRRVGPHESPGG